MESTQHKLYEIEDFVDQAIKNESEDDQQEENKNDDKYGDKFEEQEKPAAAGAEESKKGEGAGGAGMFPNSGISVEINMGVKSSNLSDYYIPVKSGTTCPMMQNPPFHIKDAEDFDPLYVPQENILEDCLRREAERVAH